jgi:hypothetical protein
LITAQVSKQTWNRKNQRLDLDFPKTTSMNELVVFHITRTNERTDGIMGSIFFSQGIFENRGYILQLVL